MSKPIQITDDMRTALKTEIESFLGSLKMSDGKITYSKSFEYENANAVLYLSTKAYAKITVLVAAFLDEVGWHGAASKVGENEYLIEDIYVYPQEVSGAATNTDQCQYVEWLYDLEDEVFSKIRMHGHSHVNMRVSASLTDLEHRGKILSQLGPDMFYIFMIWNKSLEVNTSIYDMAANILYENKDITVKISGVNSLDDFIGDAAEKVKKKSVRIQPKSKKKRNAAAPILPRQSVWNYPNDSLYDYYDL